MKKLKKRFIAIIGVVIVAAVVLVIWSPPVISATFDPKIQVSISARDFVPVDTNVELAKQSARLLVINDFHATKLNNDRSLHVYLPPSYYENTDKKYPVLYANDGKNVFDSSDWSKESMNMNTQADKLISEGKMQEIIIVGIDNIGENRVGEYSHWDGFDQGKPVTGVGELYEDFVLNDVKPFIDKNFRTLPDRENTSFLGESIGGLSVFNIGFKYPEVFGKLAMISPYLGWGDGRLYQMISDGPYKEKQPFKLWIDVGSEEGAFVDMVAQAAYLLLNNGYKYVDDIAVYEAPGGKHSESYWAKQVESILIYFYGSIGQPQSLNLYTDVQISLSDNFIKHINAIITYDSGFKMTDPMGSYSVQTPEVLKVENFGGAMYPLAEGTSEVTYTTTSDLTAKTTITVVK